jgi:predicted kinase
VRIDRSQTPIRSSGKKLLFYRTPPKKGLRSLRRAPRIRKADEGAKAPWPKIVAILRGIVEDGLGPKAWGETSPERLDAALRSGELKSVLSALGVEDVLARLRAAIVPALARSRRDGASRMAVRLRGGRVRKEAPPARVKPSAEGDLLEALTSVRGESVEWAERRAGELITGISDSTREAIRRLLARSLRGEFTVFGLRSRILDGGLIGLLPQHAEAVESWREELLDQGLSEAEADEEANEYAGDLLKWRAETIARTEVLTAENEGEKAIWRESVDRGLLDPEEMERVWITSADERVCPICDPLEGAQVGIDEQWDTSVGPSDGPPLHPQCRCTAGLVERSEKMAKGGPGSGNFGHAGRPGEVGGSASGGFMLISESELDDRWSPSSVQSRWVRDGEAVIVHATIVNLISREGEDIRDVNPDGFKVRGIRTRWDQGDSTSLPEAHLRDDGRLHVTDGRFRIAAAGAAGDRTVPIVVSMFHPDDKRRVSALLSKRHRVEKIRPGLPARARTAIENYLEGLLREGASPGKAERLVRAFRERFEQAHGPVRLPPPKRPLYVRRPLLNGEDLREWYSRQGVEGIVPASEMHVTLAYSKIPFRWPPQGERDSSPLVVPASKHRFMEKLGVEGSVALRFDDQRLRDRWAWLVAQGATWGWLSYKPHVTILVDPKFDLATVEPWKGPLRFGPEVWQEPSREALAKGGPGSGNFGHAGRPGEVGGSAPGEGGGSARDEGASSPSPVKIPQKILDDKKFQERSAFVDKTVKTLIDSKKMTIDMFRDSAGRWSPEREALHDEILKEYIEKARAAPKERQAVVMAGPSGAGKSHFLRTHGEAEGVPQGVVINADDFKEIMIERGMIPKEYLDAGLKTNETSWLIHEESSYLSKEAQKIALRMGANVILDSTLSGETERRLAKLDVFEGYDVKGILIDATMERSLTGAYDRYVTDGTFEGRYASMEVVSSQAPKTSKPAPWSGEAFRSNNAENFNAAIEARKFSSWIVFDRERQEIIDRSS